jgi:toxin CptA
MPNSPHSSSASASFRPPTEAFEGRSDWKPSAVLRIALIALGLLAGLSLLASDLSPAFAWPAAFVATGWGAWLARRESRREPFDIHWRADGNLLVAGERADAAELHWRGPLAFLSWRDAAGRRRRLAWWPDTLPAPRRRELRLAAAAADAARQRARMAP